MRCVNRCPGCDRRRLVCGEFEAEEVWIPWVAIVLAVATLVALAVWVQRTHARLEAERMVRVEVGER